MMKKPAGSEPTEPATLKAKLKGAVVVLGVFVFVPLGVLMMIWSDTCQHRVIIDDVISLSERYRAQYIVTDCGESMQPASEVKISVRKEGGVWSDSTTVLLFPGIQTPTLSWQTGDLLKISVNDETEIIKRRVTWREASIEVSKIQSPNNEG